MRTPVSSRTCHLSSFRSILLLRLQHFSSCLCFVFDQRRHSWDSVSDFVLSAHVLQRQYPERKELLCPYHIHTLRSSRTPWFWWLQKTYTFHRLWGSEKFTTEKWPSHTGSSRENSHTKFDEQFTSNTSLIASRSVFDFLETTNPQSVQMKSTRRMGTLCWCIVWTWMEGIRTSGRDPVRVIEEQLLEDRLPSVDTDAGRGDTLAKENQE